GVPVQRQLPPVHALQLPVQLRILLTISQPQGLPGSMGRRAATTEVRREMLGNALWHMKLQVRIPAVELLRQPHLLAPQGLPVRLASVMFMWRAVANVAVDDDQRRLVMSVEELLHGTAQQR